MRAHAWLLCVRVATGRGDSALPLVDSQTLPRACACSAKKTWHEIKTANPDAGPCRRAGAAICVAQDTLIVFGGSGAAGACYNDFFFLPLEGEWVLSGCLVRLVAATHGQRAVASPTMTPDFAPAASGVLC